MAGAKRRGDWMMTGAGVAALAALAIRKRGLRPLDRPVFWTAKELLRRGQARQAGA